MSVLASNLTIRISNKLQQRLRERTRRIKTERGERATSLNKEAEKALIEGLRVLEAKGS